MAYSVADADDFAGNFKKIRAALGVSAFGINQVELPAGYEKYPDHDEVESGHEEVFYRLRGSGTITVDGEEVAMRPGRYVFVTPESRRKLLPGPHGMTVIVVGGGAPKI